MPAGDQKAGLRLRTAARLYVASVLVLGTGLLVGAWSKSGLTGAMVPLSALGFWAFFSLAAESFWLETSTRAGMVSMALTVNVASLFLLPPHFVLAVGALSVGLSDLLLHRRGGLKAGFNAAQTVISLAASLAAIRLLGGQFEPKGLLFLLQRPQAVVAAPCVFFAVNTLLVSGIVSLSRGLPFWKAWRENFGFGYHFLSSGILSLLGLLLVVSFDGLGYIAGLLFLLLFFFIRDSYRRYLRERARRTPELA